VALLLTLLIVATAILGEIVVVWLKDFGFQPVGFCVSAWWPSIDPFLPQQKQQ